MSISSIRKQIPTSSEKRAQLTVDKLPCDVYDIIFPYLPHSNYFNFLLTNKFFCWMSITKLWPQSQNAGIITFLFFTRVLNEKRCFEPKNSTCGEFNNALNKTLEYAIEKMNNYAEAMAAYFFKNKSSKSISTEKDFQNEILSLFTNGVKNIKIERTKNSDEDFSLLVLLLYEKLLNHFCVQAEQVESAKLYVSHPRYFYKYLTVPAEHCIKAMNFLCDMLNDKILELDYDVGRVGMLVDEEKWICPKFFKLTKLRYSVHTFYNIDSEGERNSLKLVLEQFITSKSMPELQSLSIFIPNDLDEFENGDMIETRDIAKNRYCPKLKVFVIEELPNFYIDGGSFPALEKLDIQSAKEMELDGCYKKLQFLEIKTIRTRQHLTLPWEINIKLSKQGFSVLKILKLSLLFMIEAGKYTEGDENRIKSRLSCNLSFPQLQKLFFSIEHFDYDGYDDNPFGVGVEHEEGFERRFRFMEGWSMPNLTEMRLDGFYSPGIMYDIEKIDDSHPLLLGKLNFHAPKVTDLYLTNCYTKLTSDIFPNLKNLKIVDSDLNYKKLESIVENKIEIFDNKNNETKNSFFFNVNTFKYFNKTVLTTNDQKNIRKKFLELLPKIEIIDIQNNK